MTAVTRGINYRKNRRTRLAKKRKRALEREGFTINNEPPFRRTLRKDARQTINEERDRGYVRPWVRDPAYRLQSTPYPSASLLGLPREIRQRILYLAKPDKEKVTRWSIRVSYYVQVAGPLRTGEPRAERGKKLCKRIGDLSCVSPVFRIDMGYVGARWLKEDVAVGNQEAEKRWAGYVIAGDAGEQGKKKGRVVQTKRKKARYEKKRPVKCWYCEDRHFDGDPTCPLQRRSRLEWLSKTKVIKNRSWHYLQGEEGFTSQKIRFED